MVTSDDIKARVRETPFVPLRIVTSSGQKFDVLHPDLIMVGRRILVVGTASTDDPTQFDRATQVAIMHVTALQNLPVPASSGGNGPS